MKTKRSRKKTTSEVILKALLGVSILYMLHKGLVKQYIPKELRDVSQSFDRIFQITVWSITAIIVLLFLIQISQSIGKMVRRRNRRFKLKESRIYDIDRMTGTQFEEFLTVYFSDMGYKVEEIGGKGDHGADRILTETKTGRRICVQAKCWSKNVTFEAVQQVFTAQAIYKCQEAWIITNRGFTKQVRKTADDLKIDLWDRERLIDHMYVYRKDQKKKVAAGNQKFLAAPSSNVFHDLSCEHGRGLKNRPGSIVFHSFNEAQQSGRRKCNCIK